MAVKITKYWVDHTFGVGAVLKIQETELANSGRIREMVTHLMRSAPPDCCLDYSFYEDDPTFRIQFDCLPDVFSLHGNKVFYGREVQHFLEDDPDVGWLKAFLKPLFSDVEIRTTVDIRDALELFGQTA